MRNEYTHPSYQTQEDVLLRHDLIGTPDRRSRQQQQQEQQQQHYRHHPASLVPVPLHRDSQEELSTAQQSAIISLNPSNSTVHHPLQNFVNNDILPNDERGNRTTDHNMFSMIPVAQATVITTLTANTDNDTSYDRAHVNNSQFHHVNANYTAPLSSTTEQDDSQIIHTNIPPEMSFHMSCHNSFTEATEAVAAAVVEVVADTRKRAHESILNSAEGEDYHEHDGSSDGQVSNDRKVIKARKAFSLKEKIAYVMAFKKDCQKCNHVPIKEQGEDYDVTVVEEEGSPDDDQQRQTCKQDRDTTCDVTKTTKLKSWLKEKNQKEGTIIAYATMYKWVKKYGKMDEERGSDVGHSSVGHLKKLRTRPYQELETILVEYLRVRNDTLRKKGLPLSNVAFIKDRANMFYRDMYGNGEADGSKGFKCSSGWVHRFKARYKGILEPPDCQGMEASMDGMDLQYGITATQPMMVGEQILPQGASKSTDNQVIGQESAHLQFPTNPLAAPHLQDIEEDSHAEL